MKQILARLALALPVVWLVVSLVFLLIHLVPGDPILQMLGESAAPLHTDRRRDAALQGKRREIYRLTIFARRGSAQRAANSCSEYTLAIFA